MLDLVIEAQPKTIKKKIIIRKNTNDVEQKLTEQFTSLLNLNNDYNNFKSTENLNMNNNSENNVNSPIIKVKKQIKKPILKNNKIISNNNDLLNTAELTYDLNIKNEFLVNLSLHNKTINYNLINKLPQLGIKNTNIVNMNDDADDCDEEINETNINNDIDDIDKDNLEMDKIGDKNYYFDYDKGIIYNLKFIEVGHIDEYGEINLNDD